MQAGQVTTGQPGTADGVVYTDVAGAPGLRMFRCEVFNATLSTRGCSARWSGAQGGPAKAAARVARSPIQDEQDPRDLLSACRSCPIGAAHSGHVHIHHSWLFGMALCPRCRKGALRMIGDRVCVNCYNREREMLKGVNGKGTAPSKLMLRPLHTVTYRSRAGDGAGLQRAGRVIDTMETMISALRRTKGELAFGFGGSVGLLRQGRLF